MPIEFHTVDAFTSEPFSGNPAAVVLADLGDDSSDGLRQQLAAEFNLAETAFARPLSDHTPEKPHLELRWFTPEVEVPLCGHATLATTAVLFSATSPIKLAPTATEIRFESRQSGTLISRKHTSSSAPKFTLDFPAEDYSALSVMSIGAAFDDVRKLVETCCPELKGQVARVVRLSRFGVLVELSPRVDIEGLKVDTQTLMQDKEEPFLIIFTQPSPDRPRTQGRDRDVYSRVFAPLQGIPEDPVTGAAHTCVAPYWLGTEARSRLKDSRFRKEGENLLKCRQVSKRGGDMDVVYHAQEGRVDLIGSAKIMVRGTVDIEA